MATINCINDESEDKRSKTSIKRGNFLAKSEDIAGDINERDEVMN